MLGQKSVMNPDGNKLIVVDWGTTSLRCDLVDETGKALESVETQAGIQFIKDRRFEEELMIAIAPWLDAHGDLPVIALGMITSKNGWFEVPYVPCPASPADFAKGILAHTLSNGIRLYFLAGMTDKSRQPYPDVMRGEETQIVGFGLDEALTIVLPGTHSKWAKVAGGHIEAFQTFVTGEIFALLSQHSFIAKIAGENSRDDDWESLSRGRRQARIALF